MQLDGKSSARSCRSSRRLRRRSCHAWCSATATDLSTSTSSGVLALLGENVLALDCAPKRSLPLLRLSGFTKHSGQASYGGCNCDCSSAEQDEQRNVREEGVSLRGAPRTKSGTAQDRAARKDRGALELPGGCPAGEHGGGHLLRAAGRVDHDWRACQCMYGARREPRSTVRARALATLARALDIEFGRLRQDSGGLRRDCACPVRPWISSFISR